MLGFLRLIFLVADISAEYRVLRIPLLVVVILLLGACAKQPEAALPAAWARADGRPVNSGLLDIDSLNCRDEMQSPDGTARSSADKNDYSRARVDDFVGCMRAHGYVQVKS
jgi:hypothetical protein